MSLVAAVVVPAAPALLPGLGGSADPLGPLRSTARDVVAEALAAAPGARVVVVASATHREGGAARRPVRQEWPLDAPSGAARYTHGRVMPDALPTGLEIGRELLDGLGAGERVRLVSVADDAAPPECATLGARLVADAPTVLVVVGDGSATRTLKAPGHLDERSEDFDAALSQALAAVDGPALLAVDPHLADALWCRGRPALQVLGGAASQASALHGRVVLDVAPYGVGYLVATWLPR
ncbi:hypothetical protein GCM10009633_31230 [Janibacter melonis]|uniref:hypothetical protein n=1 Tax=Janibacter melonis TaxID=262209 RepID=UPI001E38896F|nr:hypothetical protein [Janibacter melonis]MCB5991672.1 hypothetical protein [Janibacter melonis]